MSLLHIFTSVLLFLNTSCHNSKDNLTTQTLEPNNKTELAKVINVSFSGEENNYQFNIEVLSPDTGCDQYANWWEVISEDGSTLIYRRILGHSHVSEQPFVRSGNHISITQNQTVIIRAHMNNNGYGKIAYRGSVKEGFVETELASDFAHELANQAPLPSGCAF